LLADLYAARLLILVITTGWVVTGFFSLGYLSSMSKCRTWEPSPQDRDFGLWQSPAIALTVQRFLAMRTG
jgi:hypothetical protein